MIPQALLWNKYWISTLSSSSLISNRDYTVKSIRDLAEKIEQVLTLLVALSVYARL
jgi:hypothetical protein